MIASKWYTSARSIPAGEGWQYDVPNVSDIYQSSQTSKHAIHAGDGKRIIARSLAVGWSSEQYGDQQIGNEQFIWRDKDTVIYSKKVYQERSGIFEYSGGEWLPTIAGDDLKPELADVHSGVHGIYSRNLTTGETLTLVDPFPGGASRPELSRDGRTLAFVRRVRDKEGLALL